MASIHRSVELSVSAESVWERLRDFYALHERLVPGFVTECRPEPGARVLTFFNGLVVRELLVTHYDPNYLQSLKRNFEGSEAPRIALQWDGSDASLAEVAARAIAAG